MRERVAWTAGDALPSPSDVLHLQGIEAGTDVPAHIRDILESALSRYLDLAEPCAVVADISVPDFVEVYRGDGRNAPETPLDGIYPQADRLVLMAATVGHGVSRVVRELFAAHDMASGCMLDSVASAATDRLADLLAERFTEAGREPALPYSPGYCGWHVSGQRALFRYLAPEDVGITLNASCLMQPLKSVSGVLVAGPAGIHKFRPTYSFCGPCDDKPCRHRIASVLRKQSQETLS